MERLDFTAYTYEQLAYEYAFGPTSHRHWAAQAEMQRRMSVAQDESLKSQTAAANAAEKTANYTKSSSRWMFWSVVAIAITSGLQAVFAGLAWYAQSH